MSGLARIELPTTHEVAFIVGGARGLLFAAVSVLNLLSVDTLRCCRDGCAPNASNDAVRLRESLHGCSRSFGLLGTCLSTSLLTMSLARS